MKLKEYAKKINELAKQAPDAEVIYAQDDEGNAFHPVVYEPSLGGCEDGEFYPTDVEHTYVCIN